MQSERNDLGNGDRFFVVEHEGKLGRWRLQTPLARALLGTAQSFLFGARARSSVQPLLVLTGATSLTAGVSASAFVWDSLSFSACSLSPSLAALRERPLCTSPATLQRLNSSPRTSVSSPPDADPPKSSRTSPLRALLRMSLSLHHQKNKLVAIESL